MKINVKYFAMCREITGQPEEVIELKNGATTTDFWQVILEKYPRLEPYRAMSRLAVNMNYITDTIELNEQDEICIIPPVSGG
ncbi:MAG: molybdopterin converting factor subunit 1 [Gemmatimonadetes bacterium]|nr:MAG: molybdopterin converting factor subunit 1 [Gemmatimonadota bacterium]